MTHTILMGAELLLHAERAEGAPDGIYQTECMTCLEMSARVDSDPNPVARWAILHTEQHGMAHSQFLVTTERHWRVDPVHTQRGTPAESQGEQTLRLAPVDPAPPERERVRRRAPRRWETAVRGAATRLEVLTGPFVLLALGTVCALGGFLLGGKGSG